MIFSRVAPSETLRRFEHTLLVRPSMDNRGDSTPNPFGIGCPGFTGEPYNATQSANRSSETCECLAKMARRKMA